MEANWEILGINAVSGLVVKIFYYRFIGTFEEALYEAQAIETDNPGILTGVRPSRNRMARVQQYSL